MFFLVMKHLGINSLNNFQIYRTGDYSHYYGVHYIPSTYVSYS